MRKILYLIICLPLLLLSACDVHEWPETPEFVKMHLRLNYETDMTEWEHLYDGAEVIEQGYGETYDNHRDLSRIGENAYHIGLYTGVCIHERYIRGLRPRSHARPLARQLQCDGMVRLGADKQ